MDHWGVMLLFCSSRIVHPYRRNQPWFQVYTSVCPRRARREKASNCIIFLCWTLDTLATANCKINLWWMTFTQCCAQVCVGVCVWGGGRHPTKLLIPLTIPSSLTNLWVVNQYILKLFEKYKTQVLDIQDFMQQVAFVQKWIIIFQVFQQFSQGSYYVFLECYTSLWISISGLVNSMNFNLFCQ